jgi:hypothetical protein
MPLSAGDPLLDVAAYDVAPGGARLVMPMPTSGTRADNRPTHVTFLLNFADELRRRTR